MATASSFKEQAEIPEALLLERTWMHKNVSPRHWTIADIVITEEYWRAATKWYTAKARLTKTV